MTASSSNPSPYPIDYHGDGFRIYSWHTFKSNEYNPSQDLDFYLEISGKTYCGSAFYIHSIPGIMARQGKFEHPAYGRYFWASNFILLQEPTVACLVEAIEHMISDGNHELAFLEVEPDVSEEPKAT